jgi:hypothetical protein
MRNLRTPLRICAALIVLAFLGTQIAANVNSLGSRGRETVTIHYSITLHLAPSSTTAATTAYAGACDPAGFLAQLESQLIQAQQVFDAHMPRHAGWLPYLPKRYRRWERQLYDDVNWGVSNLPVNHTICAP